MRLQPRKSPENAEKNLPHVRRKRLKENFQRDPEKYLDVFEKTYESFQARVCKFSALDVSHPLRKKLYFELRKISKDLNDYIEAGLFDMPRAHYVGLRKLLHRFL